MPRRDGSTRTREPGITKRTGINGPTYRVRLTGTDPDTGERRVVSQSFKTFEAARDFKRKTAHELRAGVYQEPSQELLGDYLTRWLASRQDIRPATRGRYQLALDRHILPRLGAIPLGKLASRHIQALYNELADTSWPPMIRAVLRPALRQALIERLIPYNPADGLLAHQGGKKPPHEQAWNAAQLATFLEAARSHRWFPLFWTAATTGLRLGELQALAWSEVDLAGATVQVIRTRTTGADGKPAIGPPKADASHRRLAIDAETVTVLREHWRDQTRRRETLDDAWDESEPGLVFDRGDGAMLHPASVNYVMAGIIRQCDLPPLTFHGLRHTHGSLLAAAGRPLHYVQRRLGHAKLTTTSLFYLHAVPGTERADADAFAGILTAGFDQMMTKAETISEKPRVDAENG